MPSSDNLGYQLSGSLSAATQTFLFTVLPEMSTVNVTVAGTWAATLLFEQSSDAGATWTAATGTPQPSGNGATSTTAAGVWQFDVTALNYLRVRCSAYTSGLATIFMSANDTGSLGQSSGMAPFGYVLTSNGPGNPPSYQLPATGVISYSKTITATQLKNNTGSFVITAAANAAGGNTVYTATGLAAGVNLYAGLMVTVAGFTTSANNGGPWLITASSNTTLTIANPAGVAETHAGTTVAGGIQLLPAAATGFFWVIPEAPIIQYIAGGTPFTLGDAAQVLYLSYASGSGGSSPVDWDTFAKGVIDQATSNVQGMVSGATYYYDYAATATTQSPADLASANGDAVIFSTFHTLTAGTGHIVINFKAYQLAVGT